MRRLACAIIATIAPVFLGYAPFRALADPAPANAAAPSQQPTPAEIRLKWKLAAVKRIKAFLAYPEELKGSGVTAIVWLRIRIDKDSKIHEVEIAKSSGYDILDAAAASDVKRTSALPKVPKAAQFGFPASVLMPIKYIESSPQNSDAPPR